MKHGCSAQLTLILQIRKVTSLFQYGLIWISPELRASENLISNVNYSEVVCHVPEVGDIWSNESRLTGT